MTGQEKQSQPEISEMQTEIIERLEQTVASSSERIRKILANIPLSLVIANNKGVIEAVNERALASLDYKVQDLVERELGFLFEDAGAILVEDRSYRTRLGIAGHHRNRSTEAFSREEHRYTDSHAHRPQSGRGQREWFAGRGG